MDNLGQLRTRVRRYLRELNPDTSFWTDTFLNQLFNAAYRRRCAQLIMAFEGWFVMTNTQDFYADQANYNFPSGLQRVHKVEHVTRDGDFTIPIQRDERHYAGNYIDNGPGGDGWVGTYRMIDNGIRLEPTPSEYVENGLRIEYAALPDKLEEGDTINSSFPEIFDELLIIDTVVLALEAEGVHESGPMAALLRERANWEWDWERFIDQRTVSRDKVTPFPGPYRDA